MLAASVSLSAASSTSESAGRDLQACDEPQVPMKKLRRADRPQGGRDGHPRFSPEAFRKELSTYIARQAQLTDAEAKAVFPIFWEMKEKLRGIEHKMHASVCRTAKNESIEADCKRTLKQLARFKEQSARIENEYIDRMANCISARKVVMMLQADRNFGKKKFRQMMQNEKR